VTALLPYSSQQTVRGKGLCTLPYPGYCALAVCTAEWLPSVILPSEQQTIYPQRLRPATQRLELWGRSRCRVVSDGLAGATPWDPSANHRGSENGISSHLISSPGALVLRHRGYGTRTTRLVSFSSLETLIRRLSGDTGTLGSDRLLRVVFPKATLFLFSGGFKSIIIPAAVCVQG